MIESEVADQSAELLQSLQLKNRLHEPFFLDPGLHHIIPTVLRLEERENPGLHKLVTSWKGDSFGLFSTTIDTLNLILYPFVIILFLISICIFVSNDCIHIQV